jgi:hypothetical protein
VQDRAGRGPGTCASHAGRRSRRGGAGRRRPWSPGATPLLTDPPSLSFPFLLAHDPVWRLWDPAKDGPRRRDRAQGGWQHAESRQGAQDGRGTRVSQGPGGRGGRGDPGHDQGGAPAGGRGAPAPLWHVAGASQAPRIGRNPRSGATAAIAARRVVRCTAAQTVQQGVAGAATPVDCAGPPRRGCRETPRGTGGLRTLDARLMAALEQCRPASGRPSRGNT